MSLGKHPRKCRPWDSLSSKTPPVRNTVFFFLSSFFPCPAWLKIRCTYLMAEPSQGPLSQGRMDARRHVGILGEWDVFLGCLSRFIFKFKVNFSKKFIIIIAAIVSEHLLCARHSAFCVRKQPGGGGRITMCLAHSKHSAILGLIPMSSQMRKQAQRAWSRTSSK